MDFLTEAAEVLKLARAKGLKIATAESCTGGMIAAALTDVPGSSAVFDRGFVTYSNEAKREMLKVTEESLASFGAVSEQVAEEMAMGALWASDAQLAVAVTGIAGPGGSGNKPEGLVCFAVAQTGQDPASERVEFGAIGRAEVRRNSRDHALALLRNALS